MLLNDKTFQITRCSAAMCVCVITAIALVIANFFYAQHHDHLGVAAALFAAAGAVLRIKAYASHLCKGQREIAALLEDWQAAFEMGREVGREESAGGVRQLR